MSGEFVPSEETRRGYFTYTSEKTGASKQKELEYGVVDGFAVFEGDIIVGTERGIREAEGIGSERIIAEESLDELPGEPEVGMVVKGLVVVGVAHNLWPAPRIPYTIDPGLSQPVLVEQALRHWEKHTVLSFVPRQDEVDYLTFEPGQASRSYVGRQGGQQVIQLAPIFSPGTVIHEIGHALGLWHEQSREDRDEYVTIHWENILPNCEHNFTQRIADGDDVGDYDYDSIMHYPSFAFSRNNMDTITAPAGVKIGQRNGLSLGDIAGINGLYGEGVLYVGNTSSKAFHNRDCHWVDRMAASNKRYFTELEQALAGGYRACRACFPKLDVD
jgi:astacin